MPEPKDLELRNIYVYKKRKRKDSGDKVDSARHLDGAPSSGTNHIIKLAGDGGVGPHQRGGGGQLQE